MGRSRLGALAALVVVLVAGAVVGVAPAATQADAGTPIACGGSIARQVTISGQASQAGVATDVVLVLDTSGSMAEPKLGQMTAAAKAVIDKLDASDGAADHTIGLNRVAVVTYPTGSADATLAAGFTSSYDQLMTAVSITQTRSGGSPHDLAINRATTTLSTSGSQNARAMILITDGQVTGSTALPDAAATTAKGTPNSVRIVSVGIGADGTTGEANLKRWASNPDYYQSGSGASGINTGDLVSDLGSAVVTPTPFSVTETLGTNYKAGTFTTSAGSSVTPNTDGTPGPLTWTGTFTSPTTQVATLGFTATRNGNDVFSVTNEVVSTTSTPPTGGTLTSAPSLSTDVLPCGGSALDTETCSGSSCGVTGTSGGVQYTVNTQNAPTGTSLFLTGFSTPPPAGVCKGFDANTKGIQLDIRPLSVAGKFKIVIPKAALGTKKWWQTDVCVGTNMRFITEIESLATLRPGATLVNGGGALPSRWWGLLPSIPRLVKVPGVGWVTGPWITKRSVDSAGNASVEFTMPYVAGSEAASTDNKAGFDPKVWTG